MKGWTSAELIYSRLGRGLVHRYQAYKQSEDRVGELILRTELIWFKTTEQFKILENIKDSLDLDLLQLFDQCLRRLEVLF
jgi:hypothetical protein